MYPKTLPSDIFPSGDMTITTNNADAYFFEYECFGGSGIQKGEPKNKEEKSQTWQQKTDDERDRNLRGLFGYD